MNPNQSHESRPAQGASRAITHLCLRSCKKVLAQIRKVKRALFAQWRDGLEDHERMLKLALNEAEALAWQTSYPHLFFPALAAEKIQAVLDWARRQQGLRRADPVPGLETSPAHSIFENRNYEVMRDAA